MYWNVECKCKLVYTFSVKGVIGCKIHFYMLFELKCVLAMTQTPYNDKNPPSAF